MKFEFHASEIENAPAWNLKTILGPKMSENR